ncbi:ABC transporter [Penicillium alfredii]|uniref:ABC transporter n=1 Tax=Penicillium alfredii TaxID=1506179 RepID=A0A9W9FL97_9EURO|nr:ABC transporter [Penicillium alfredii]KAJ5102252.1 ABC transporter [Penicillium alfredii]
MSAGTLLSTRQGEKQAYSEDYQHCESETSPSGWELTEALMQSLALKDTGIEIGFRDLEFRPDKKNPPIIQGLSGNIPRGAFLGIMGPSGAGKTTLMNILAGKTCQTAGITTLNGAEEDLSRFKQLVGFVPQVDAALAELTVRENVLLSARIQLGGVKEDAFIKQHVESIMSCMGLEHIQNNIVGDPTTGKRISGGERRRVSIALRLVAMPLALLLDEPTSGLDASTALSIMRLLESISRMGVTVVCVIHQPRAEIFKLFHHLLLLDHTNQVYMGNADDMKAHFEARGYNISDRVNPADAIMDILSSDTELLPFTEDIQGMDPVETCCSHARTETLNALSEMVASRKARWYRQCSLHLVRGLRQQIRQTTTSVVGLIVGAISGLVMGLAVYKFDGNLFHGIFRHPFEPLSSAVEYTLVPQLALLSCLAISLAAAPAGVETFGGEKNNFYREVDAGDSRSAYFVGKELSTIPRIVLSALHFTTFYIILATPAISFGMLLVLNMLFFYCVYGLSSAVAALVQRENALFLSLLLCLIVGICNGYGPLLSSIKSWNVEWFWYLCPGTWFAEAYFTEHVERFAYLYDTESAAKFTGYVAGRTGFDGG